MMLAVIVLERHQAPDFTSVNQESFRLRGGSAIFYPRTKPILVIPQIFDILGKKEKA